MVVMTPNPLKGGLNHRMSNNNMEKQRTKCEVWSRIVGYIRPVQQWNEGKVSEWKERKTFQV